MIYLDNAATGGNKPVSVQNAVLASLRMPVNAGRGGYRLSVTAGENVYKTRTLLAELFDGYGAEHVAFTASCTHALNIALFGLLKSGDHVVTTSLEHNAVLRPLYELEKRGVAVSVATVSQPNDLFDEIKKLCTPRTKAVVVTSASNVTGACPDLSTIRAYIPESTLLIVDGAQGAGHVPILMKKWGVDALAIAGHKGMHAVQGIGALLFSDRISPAPFLYGGTGSVSFEHGMPDFYPDRLEAGSLNYTGICALREGALLVKSRRTAHSQALLSITATLIERLRALPYTVYSEPNPCGIVSLAHPDLDSNEVTDLLSEKYDIAVRGGLQCAPLVHKALKTFPEGLIRVSFNPFQGKRELDALLYALKEISV